MENQRNLEMYDTRGDISHSGTILELLYYGFVFITALIEAIDNSTDQIATRIKIVLDESNEMMYIIDNGRGANKSDLKRFSTISEISSSANDRNGLFDKGAKFMLAYFTQLYQNKKDEKEENNDANNLIKNIFSRTIYAISKSDNYDRLRDRPISHIEIDFLKAINGGLYKNDPQDANPLTEEIWNKLSYDPNGTGMILMIPMDRKVFEEAKENIYSDKITKSLQLKIGTMYYDYFNNSNFEIEIEILNSININNNNGISIVIDNTDSKHFSILPFDTLHYDEISEEDKKTTNWSLYVNKDNNDDIKLTTHWPYQGNIEIDGDKMIHITEEKLKEIQDNYKLKTIIEQKLAHSDTWDNDLPYLEKIFGNTTQSTNEREQLNTRGIKRGRKIIHESQTQIITTGDMYKRYTERMTRERTSYNPKEGDKYIGLLVKKSELKEILIHKNIAQHIFRIKS